MRRVIAVTVLSLVMIGTGACAGRISAPPPLPKGWKVVAYRGVGLDVPRSWKVGQLTANCGGLVAPSSGLAVIQGGPVDTNCTLQLRPKRIVVVMESSHLPFLKVAHAVTLHGLKAYEATLATSAVSGLHSLGVTLPTEHMLIFITVGDTASFPRGEARLAKQIRSTIHPLGG